MHRDPSGYWCLNLRVANIRKHQILKPSIRMIMTAVDSITPSNYTFEHLEVSAAAASSPGLAGWPPDLELCHSRRVVGVACTSWAQPSIMHDVCMHHLHSYMYNVPAKHHI